MKCENFQEEYKEVDNSGAGNQGRGKDISTIIEADKEEKKALLQAATVKVILLLTLITFWAYTK